VHRQTGVSYWLKSVAGMVNGVSVLRVTFLIVTQVTFWFALDTVIL
jgi:hypothetical protein